jgi:hypothetical protein
MTKNKGCALNVLVKQLPFKPREETLFQNLSRLGPRQLGCLILVTRFEGYYIGFFIVMQ